MLSEVTSEVITNQYRTPLPWGERWWWYG